MSDRPIVPVHGADVCFWRNERDIWQERFKGMQETLTEMSRRLDTIVSELAEVKAQGRDVENLKKVSGDSREEIAALKVKASLLGIASAAALEIIFVLVKHWKQ